MQSQAVSKVFLISTKEGFRLKSQIVKALEKSKRNFEDLGVTNEGDSTDILDLCVRLYEKISSTEGSRGIFVTDYGSDASMYMCKFKGIRCAHITDYYTADMCRKHNDANVLALAQGSMGQEVAVQAVEAFLTSEFESNAATHPVRVAKIAEFEK